MNNLAVKLRPGSHAGMSGTAAGESASPVTFGIFIYFLVDFFLHLPARIPGYGLVRPTLLLVLVISISLFVQREKFRGWTRDPIVSALLVLMVYLVVSLPLVEWPGSVVKNNLGEFVKAIVFFYFMVLLVDSDRRLKIFLTVFIGCQVLRVLEPLFLNITDGYWGSRAHLGGGEFSQRLAGAPSDVINPNELGFVIVTAIPFLHYLMWSSGSKARLLYLLLMPPLLYALILTQSRGAFLALLVVALFVFKESSRKFSLVVVAVLIAMAGWQVMTDEQKDRYLSLVGESETSNAATVDGRLEGMMREFSLGFERPFVGHGLGTTPEAKTHILGKRQASHNLYAELLIELGIIGTFIFMRFLFKVYRRLIANHKQISQTPENSSAFYINLNKALLSVFWMYVVYSFNYWGLSQYYWYLLAGTVVVFYRLTQSNLVAPKSSEPMPVQKPTKNRFSNLVDISGRR
ncbi:O-antigen ligase family protein [Marinobacter sp. TBZ242]|uniref:O-antigen ligase family protein n=1 Tax=Marinobacter azerbaijanicus TaxID=3050455 RepID=A0ABT7I8X6_9GAMM|nr:O-antigen ligase family protein [Marinobacter sp. TBZ242]MDL0429708.1 O-antigen ligase family protein [Marinobacter sp. TBZ242]